MKGTLCVSVCVCVVQVGLKLKILLPLSPKCWDYRHAAPHMAERCFCKLCNTYHLFPTFLVTFTMFDIKIPNCLTYKELGKCDPFLRKYSPPKSLANLQTTGAQGSLS
jgi:hypothetical protein